MALRQSPFHKRRSTRKNTVLSNPIQGRANRGQTVSDIALVDMLVKDRVNQGLSAFPARAVRAAHRASQPNITPPPVPSTSTVEESGPVSLDELPLPEGWEKVAGEDGIPYYYHAELQKSQWHHPEEAPEYEIDLLDPSMVFSMERTVLSAYNQSFQLMMVGGGIMAVQNAHEARNDARPVQIGFIFFFSGAMYGAMSLYFHLRRMHVLKHGDNGLYNWHGSSIIWMTFLGLFLIVGLSIEIYFAILFPYIDRAKSVEIATPSPSPSS